MRWLLGLVLLLLALGTLRTVGCGDEEPQRCETDEECDDQNECTLDECRVRGSSTKYCQRVVGNVVNCDFNGIDELIEDGLCSRGGVCVKNPCDDDNECTYDLSFDAGCEHSGCTGCQPCDWNGNPGICIDGVCVEYPCNDGVICSDGDLCTHDSCDYEDEMCVFNPRCRDNTCNTGHCDPSDGSCTYTPANDGTSCSAYCVLGRPVCSGGECICLLGDVGAFEMQP